MIDLDRLCIHPDAELYPMMPPDELEALAADIRANGLLHPLMVTEIDGVPVLVDGRNRLKACELAGVKPTFAELNGQDPKAYILAANVLRRHMPKGQKAMAVAFQYPEPPTAHRGKRSEAKRAAETAGLSDRRVEYARAVLRHSRELARAVLKGDMTLDAALERVKADQAAAQSEEAMMGRLREEAPDLADAVEEGRLPLNEAGAAAQERKRQRETRSRVMTENLKQALILLAPPDEREADGYASRVLPDLRLDEIAADVNRRSLNQAARYLAALAERIPT